MKFAYADPPYLGCCRLYDRVRPAYAWEPVLYRGGRNAKHPPPLKGGKATTPRDWVSANITLKKKMTGAKPEPVCRWILDILGYRPDEDTLDDLYPGSGVMQHVLDAVAAEVPPLRVSRSDDPQETT